MVAVILGAGLATLAALCAVLIRRDRAGARAAELSTALIASTTDAILTTGLDGRITSWNAGAAALYGYTAAEIIGQPVDILTPASGREDRDALFAAVAGGTPVTVPAVARQRRDGTVIEVSITTTPLHDRDGRLIGITGISRDVDEAQRLSRELAASEERQRILLGSLPDAFVVLYDRDLHCVMLDGPVLREAGVDPSDYIGRPIAETLPPEQFAQLAPAIQRALAGETVSLVYRSALTGRNYEADVAPHRLTDGTVAGAFAVARDVTGRLDAQAKLRERERMLAEAEAVAHVGSWECDLAAGRLIWSDELCRIAGQPLGSTPTIAEFMALVHPDDRERVAARVEDAAAGTESVSEYRVRRPDGTVRWLQTRRLPRLNASGEVVRLFGTSQDITERVARERELRRLAAIVEQSSEAIVSKDAQGIITAWNPGAERLYGYPAETAIGEPISLIVPAMKAGEEQELLARALAGETLWQHHTIRRRSDGALVEVSLTISPLRDEQGVPVGASVITRDVSAARQAERDRERAIAELAEAQALAGIGSWTWDVATDTATWTAEMYRIFGRDPSAGPATSEEFFAYLHPDDRDRVAAGYAEAFGGGAAFELDYRIAAGDGVERVLHALGREEAPGQYAGTVQDVTELRAVERALAFSEEFFRSTLEHAPIGVALLAPDGRWLKVNRALCEIVGYSEAELLERTFQDITHPDDLDADLEFVRRLLAGEIPSYRLEKRYFRKSGAVVWIELSVSLVRDEHGTPLHFISHIKDVSAERVAREALAASERRFQSIAANIPGMVYRFAMGPTGELSLPFASAGSQEIYGIEPEALMADPSPIFDGVHSEDREALLTSIQRSAQALSPWEWRGRHVRANGEVRYLHGLSQPVREPGGATVWDGVIFDETAVRLSEQQEIELRRRLELVLDNLAGSAITVYDHELRVVMTDGPLFAGLDTDALTGRRLAEVASPATVALMTPRLRGALAGETSTAVLEHDVEGRTLAAHFAPYRMPDGAITGALVHWQDITPVRHAERERDEALEHFQIAFERAPIGMVIVGLDGRFQRVNQALCEITGYTAPDLLAMAPFAIVHPEDLERVQDEFGHLGEHGLTVEHRIAHAAGQPAWVQARITMIRDSAGEPVHVLAQILDITERHAYEQRLRHMADHDPLTGLRNRRGFETALEDHLARIRRYGATGALLVLDLDGFKLVNDTLGHAAGDELIINCAHALAGRLRETDVIARLGGDEFAVLLPDQDQAEAELVAQALIETVRERAATIADSHPGRVTASIGVASFGDGALSADEMLVNADLAMYEAKEAGKDRYALYSHDGHVVPRIKAQMTWLERIERALAEERFTLHAQPIIDLQTGRTVQHEVLVRMLDEHGDLIPPNTFLYIAERFGTIRELDQWVLTRAIRAMAGERERGRALPLAVNISGLSTGDADVLDTISRELRTGQVPASQLTLEITETSAVADIPRARRFADALRDIGCRLSLDDFGAGFGSFYYLKHLPFDVVKIDGEFVRHALDNAADRLVIKAVAEIAHGLGKQTVAEFVPDEETIRLLLRHGVDLAQGYYLGRPQPLEQLLAAPPADPARERTSTP